MQKKIIFVKRILVLIVTLLLLVFIFILPIKCTSVTIRTDDSRGDVVMKIPTRTCYSIYHKKFWTEAKSNPVEVLRGFSALKILFQNNQFNYVNIGNYKSLQQTTIHHLYVTDFTDNKKLMGASHNVFVGKVINSVGNNEFAGNPATQFSVEVIENIKGNLNGTVVINQEGGNKNGILYITEEGVKSLQPGSTYLFATRYESLSDFYTLNPHQNASEILSSDPSLSVTEIKILAQNSLKFKEFVEAYPNEELLQADVNHDNTRNSYNSRPILTVTSESKTITLGSSIPPLTATLTGFVNSDTASTSVTGSPSCTTTATSASPVGTYPITCTLGTLTSLTYDISTFFAGTLTITYRFDGFLQPINDTSYNPTQSLSVFKGGSTVPVKFQIKNTSGTSVESTSAPLWLTPQQLSPLSTTVSELLYTDTASTGVTFRYDPTSTQYIYNWSTKGLTTGYWYRLSAQLDDGTTRSVIVGVR